MAPAARQAAWLLLAVSGSLVLGALAFQFWGGLVPCQLCHWQRWAHLGVIAAAALALALPRLLPLALLAMLGAGALGLFHAGVEQRWWDGPGCAAPPAAGGDLLGTLIAAPVVRCDQIPWSFLGLSMAGWNVVISVAAALGGLWLWRNGWTRNA